MFILWMIIFILILFNIFITFSTPAQIAQTIFLYSFLIMSVCLYFALEKFLGWKACIAPVLLYLAYLALAIYLRIHKKNNPEDNISDDDSDSSTMF